MNEKYVHINRLYQFEHLHIKYGVADGLAKLRTVRRLCRRFKGGAECLEVMQMRIDHLYNSR